MQKTASLSDLLVPVKDEAVLGLEAASRYCTQLEDRLQSVPALLVLPQLLAGAVDLVTHVTRQDGRAVGLDSNRVLRPNEFETSFCIPKLCYINEMDD